MEIMKLRKLEKSGKLGEKMKLWKIGEIRKSGKPGKLGKRVQLCKNYIKIILACLFVCCNPRIFFFVGGGNPLFKTRKSAKSFIVFYKVCRNGCRSN